MELSLKHTGQQWDAFFCAPTITLFIKELPPLILDIFAIRRPAAELVPWSEGLSLLPQISSGSTVELLHCVITMLRNAF